MTRSHTRWLLALVVTLVAVAVVTAAPAASGTVTATQLKAGFKKATGQKLVVSKVGSSAGQYTAFNLGVPTHTKQVRYGTFTIFLVSGDVPANVETLLTDQHTGQVAPPAPGGIHWEHGVSLGGGLSWTAKQLFGSNVVLWWTTPADVKKTDGTYATLRRALKGVMAQK
jgi:hypothetical protein